MPALWPSSLRVKLLAIALFIQTIALSVIAYQQLKDAGEHLHAQAGQNIKQLAVLLNAALSVPMVQLDYAAAQDILDETRGSSHLSYLSLHDLRGQVVARSGASVVAAKQDRGLADDGGDRVFDTSIAISLAGQPLGTLYLGVPTDFLSSAQRRGLWYSLILVFVALLISALVLYVMATWLTRRLEALAVAADRVSAGDYDVQLPPAADDETGRVVQAFKQMTESIQTRELELRESRNHLLYLAERDSLTGLYNRHYFRHELQRRLDESVRGGVGGALLLFDLDEFKLINDSFGHQVGDELLIMVATEVGRQVRRNETFCRLGGDEFVLIAPSASESEVAALAQRIVQALADLRFDAGGRPVRVSCSIGVALYPSHAADAETLLACVDAAMYEAKQRGKNTWQMHRPERDSVEANLAMLTWKERINAALECDLFRLVYQGIYAMPGRRLSHVEALLRMHEEPSGRLIAPNQFIPIAERSGQVLDIDRWVIRQSIRQLQLHPDMPPIAINVSGRTFDDPTVPAYIAEQLREHGVAPQRLIVELTETAALSDLADAERFIRQLRDLGCHICLDDFGSGFASFAYLKHIASDTIKIDGMFIRDLPNDEQNQIFVKAMIEVARGLGVTTIAECVEDEVTLLMLGEFGIDYVQGYHLCRPREDLPGQGAQWGN